MSISSVEKLYIENDVNVTILTLYQPILWLLKEQDKNRNDVDNECLLFYQWAQFIYFNVIFHGGKEKCLFTMNMFVFSFL